MYDNRQAMYDNRQAMYDNRQAMYDNRQAMRDNHGQINYRLFPGRQAARNPAARRGNEGVALLTALAMLLVFSMLGTAYIGYMIIDQDTAKYQLREVRARHLAIGGINAAIGEISARLKNGEIPAGSYEFQLPVYVREGDSLVDYPQNVTVEISDESSRINVNHAPLEVLEALGIERGTVRRLKSGLPRQGEPADGERRWLASVQELLSRDFLTAQEYRALNTDLLTVHTVADQTSPAGYMNLNSAPPEVLSAIFGMAIEEAQGMAAERPFVSWQDAREKTGRDPQTYNLRPSVRAPGAMPSELSLSSRCFRLESQARIQIAVIGDRSVVSTVEAVVIFGEDGEYQIQFWSRTPSEFLEYVPPVIDLEEVDLVIDADAEEDDAGPEESGDPEVVEEEDAGEAGATSEEQ